MFQYKKTVPGDPTILPGMHTILADRGQSYQVNYIKDVEYVQRDGKPLHLQLLLPGGLLPGMESTLRYPLVVYVQGSAWGEQYVYGSLPQLVPLARAGFVVASVKHRPSSQARFPGFLQDVKSAIRFLRANAEKYFIDPSQVGIWGDSSGGHDAQMVGVTGDMEEFKTQDNRELSDGVQAVVDAEGELLCKVLNYRPFLIKPNNLELGAIFGRELHTPEEIRDCAAALQRRGARNVLVSMAGDGALLLDETGACHRMPAPKGAVRNSVGAGDSMVAGFLAGWLRTGSYREALRLGTAAGSATAFADGLATREQVESLLRKLEP